MAIRMRVESESWKRQKKKKINLSTIMVIEIIIFVVVVVLCGVVMFIQKRGRQRLQAQVLDQQNEEIEEIDERAKYERLLNDVSRLGDVDNVDHAVYKLRCAIVKWGLPCQSDEEKSSGESSLRGRVWKTLLGVRYVDASEYLHYLSLGRCPNAKDHEQIEKDHKRTFQYRKSAWLLKRMPLRRCERLVSAIVHWKIDVELRALGFERGDGNDGCNDALAALERREFVTQSMLRHCGLFLAVMPELDAFYCFRHWLQRCVPGLLSSNMRGAKLCCPIFDDELRRHAPDLAARLGRTATVYAFSHLLSMHTYAVNDEPDEIVKLWDAFVAFGPHLNFFCLLARVLLLRAPLLASAAPTNLLQQNKLPPLDACDTIRLALALIIATPADTFQRICDAHQLVEES
jgi:cell cycle arrest protein BUB2